MYIIWRSQIEHRYSRVNGRRSGALGVFLFSLKLSLIFVEAILLDESPLTSSVQVGNIPEKKDSKRFKEIGNFNRKLLQICQLPLISGKDTRRVRGRFGVQFTALTYNLPKRDRITGPID